MSHKLLGLCEEAAGVVFLLVTDPRLPFHPLACRDRARCCYRLRAHARGRGRRGRARARGRRSALCTVGCSCCRLGAEDELCDSQTLQNFATSARDQTPHLQRRVLNLVFFLLLRFKAIGFGSQEALVSTSIHFASLMGRIQM